MPMISVIMPVYNGAEFLAEAVNSVLTQTFTDFELLIIDDGSTDRTIKIAKYFEKLDPRVKVYRLSHIGLVQALNFGIEQSSGNLIARMDADDICYPTRFELQIDHLNRSGADLCGGAIEIFGKLDRVKKYPQNHSDCVTLSLFETPFAHPTIIGKAMLFKKLKYREEMNKCEDYDLWVRAIKNNYNLTNVPEILLRYRTHTTQISHIHESEQMQLSNEVRRGLWAFIFPSFNFRTIDSVLNEITGTKAIQLLSADFYLYLKSHQQIRDSSSILYHQFFKIYTRNNVSFLHAIWLFFLITLETKEKITKKVFYFLLLIYVKLTNAHAMRLEHKIFHSICLYIRNRR